MSDNDDVLFDSEPENIPAVQEPDNFKNISETNEKSEKTNTEEIDYSGYEAGSLEDFEEESEDNYEEDSGQNDTNEENTDDETDDEPSQEKKILDTEASEKRPASKKNKGLFLQRNKILTIVLGIFIIMLLFFSLVVPSLKNKKKKEKSKELDKAGITNIPNSIKNVPEETVNTGIDYTNGNSSQQSEYLSDEDFDEKYPSILNNTDNNKKENVAPVSVPKSGGSSTSDVPITNRNEQQKVLQHLSLDNSFSSVASNIKNNKYETSTPSGYNTGYSTGYSGTSNTYTPTSLTSNLDKYLAQQSGSGYYQDSYTQQNNQSGKQEFLNKNGIGGNYRWNSDYSVWKGTVISAVLDTGINTDLPGSVMGHVTTNVYSSQDGKYLLIPQGSRLYGEYNSDVSYGQNRVQVVWNTLIRPDGLEINLGSMNGIDVYGYSGYKGQKTDHPFEYVKAFGLIAMYSILDTKASNVIDTQNNAYAQNAISDVYSETKKLNNRIVDRALDIQPTNKIKSGTEVNLITNVTIDLPPMDPYEVEEKYVLNK